MKEKESSAAGWAEDPAAPSREEVEDISSYEDAWAVAEAWHRRRAFAQMRMTMKWVCPVMAGIVAMGYMVEGAEPTILKGASGAVCVILFLLGMMWPTNLKKWHREWMAMERYVPRPDLTTRAEQDWTIRKKVEAGFEERKGA